ncbi:Cysteine-rich receptor-like protein kinase 10 [Glycine max]|nr:Cysteine-rich receptor-like protein kinase 10 [Glycine max]
MATISCRPLSFLCCLYLIIVICEASFGPSYEYSKYCNNSNGNYTANCIYHTNLDTLTSNTMKTMMKLKRLNHCNSTWTQYKLQQVTSLLLINSEREALEFVYQGKLSNGQVIAIKRLSSKSGQGDIGFRNEVLLLAKASAPKFNPTKKAQLDWEKRYKIIRGIARGLLYLYEDSRLYIIHHDLKPNNILLNEEMILKITYFMKSDVFSFGILVLEIVSDQKNYGSSVGENGEVLLSFGMNFSSFQRALSSRREY